MTKDSTATDYSFVSTYAQHDTERSDDNTPGTVQTPPRAAFRVSGAASEFPENGAETHENQREQQSTMKTTQTSVNNALSGIAEESRSLYREYKEVIESILADGTELKYVLFVLRKELHGISWKESWLENIASQKQKLDYASGASGLNVESSSAYQCKMTNKCQNIIKALVPLFDKHNQMLNVQVRNSAHRARPKVMESTLKSFEILAEQTNKGRVNKYTGELEYDPAALVATIAQGRNTMGMLRQESGEEKEDGQHKGVVINIVSPAITDIDTIDCEVIE